MKKTYKDFKEQYDCDLIQQDIYEQLLAEVLSKDASAGEWISDFVKSDNPKFAGKSKEKRKQMALAAYYAKQRNEQFEIDEAWADMLSAVKQRAEREKKTTTATAHDVKHTSTGTVYTKQRDADGMSKEFKRDPNAAKRGRGRPKKNAFGEAVEFLMALDEETFDSLMEEGFDAFMEQYEQLDEISKTTLGSYIKKAGRDAVIQRKIGADFEHQADKSRKPGMKASATALADKYKAKSWSRSHNVNKAVDRLTK